MRQKLADYQTQLQKLNEHHDAEIVRLALEEDLGAGDVTTRACVPESQQASGRFLAREPLIVAGLHSARALRSAAAWMTDAAQARWRSVRRRRHHRHRARPRPHAARTRARGAEFPAAAERRSHAWRGISPMPSRAPGAAFWIRAKPLPACAPLEKMAAAPGRRHQSPHGPLRCGADQEQPHRGGRRRAPGHRARARQRPAHRDRSPHARGTARGAGRRRAAPAARQPDARPKPPNGSARSAAAPKWNFQAASPWRTSAPTPKPARISFPPAPSRIPRGRWTSASAWSSNDPRHTTHPPRVPGPADRLLSHRRLHHARGGRPARSARSLSPTSRPPAREGTATPGTPTAGAASTAPWCSSRRPVLTLALGLAAAMPSRHHRPRLRSALAQRPDARRQEVGRHPGADGGGQRRRRHRHQCEPCRISRGPGARGHFAAP